MNPENNQQPQTGSSIKQTVFHTVGSFAKKGVKKAITWASTKLLSAAAIADPEPITKVILAAADVAMAAGKFIWDKVFKKALIELKRKPLHAFVAGMTLVGLPGMIALPAGAAIASQAGGAFLTAHGAINGLFQTGGSFGKGAINLALKPIEFVTGIISGLAAAETAALPAMVGVSSSVITGGFIGIVTVGTLAAAFYVPIVSRPSPLAPKSEYFKVEKIGFYNDDPIFNSVPLINLRDNNKLGNNEVKKNGEFVYYVHITPLKENITIDVKTVQDVVYSYQETGSSKIREHEWGSQELGYDPEAKPFSFSYGVPVDSLAAFQNAMITNHVTVTASVIVEEEGEQRVEDGQIASDSLSVIIGDVPDQCPQGWPINVNPIRITQGPESTTTSTHNTAEAIDISALMGTPVYSTTKGFAHILHSRSGLGNHVTIVSQCRGRELSVIYAHLNDISVFEGQTVELGQKIGESGNSGNSDGPHLHYEFQPFRGPARMDPSSLPVREEIPRGSYCSNNACEY